MEPGSEKNHFSAEAPPPYPTGEYPATQQQPTAPGFVAAGNAPPPGGLNESILAAQAVNAAIHQNGRNPVTVVCPTCRNTTVTEITEIPNTSLVQGQSKIFYIFFGGTAVVFLTVFIIATVVSGSFIPLSVMPVFLLFLLVGFCVMKKAGSHAAKMCSDIEHRCSNCHILLGVSSGAQMMAQLQAQNRRFH